MDHQNKKTKNEQNSNKFDNRFYNDILAFRKKFEQALSLPSIDENGNNYVNNKELPFLSNGLTSIHEHNESEENRNDTTENENENENENEQEASEKLQEKMKQKTKKNIQNTNHK